MRGYHVGVEEPTSVLHICLKRKVIEEMRNFLEWRGLTSGWDHQFRCCGFDCRRFDTRGCFLLRFPSSWLRSYYTFGLRFL